MMLTCKCLLGTEEPFYKVVSELFQALVELHTEKEHDDHHNYQNHHDDHDDHHNDDQEDHRDDHHHDDCHVQMIMVRE